MYLEYKRSEVLPFFTSECFSFGMSEAKFFPPPPTQTGLGEPLIGENVYCIRLSIMTYFSLNNECGQQRVTRIASKGVNNNYRNNYNSL